MTALAQLTSSGPLSDVLADIPGRFGLLSNPSLEDEFGHVRVRVGSDDTSLRMRPITRKADVGGVDGSVVTIAGSGGARPEQLSHVDRAPRGCAPDPTVTVVICAHREDRWDDLVAAVMSVKQQTRRPAEIVLVIDHNPKLQRRSTFELPGVKVIPNDNEKGLAGARNAGVAAATAEIVAFLDDETVAAHNWLAALLRPMPTPTCSVSAARWCPSGRRGVRAGSHPSSTGSLDAVTAACPLSEPWCTTSLVETCLCGVASLSNAVVSMLRSVGSAPDDSLARRRRDVRPPRASPPRRRLSL